MSACPDKAMLLQGLVDGELDAVNAAACEAHLKVCDACNAEYVKHFPGGLPARQTARFGVPTEAKVAFSCIALAAE